MSARELITEHLDLWTGAVKKKSGSGRGSNGKVELIGIKKLRELILELAVRGRLIEQDSSEEPAHLILERLDSTVKKNKGKLRVSTLASQPIPPKGWASFQIGDYLDFQYGKSLPAKQRDDSGSVEVYGSNGVVGFHTGALTEEPCIVVGRKGSAGALNKALGPSWTTDVAYYVQPPQGFDFEFTYLLLQSLHLDQLGKGIKPGVNRNEAYALTALLPPLEEQHRIVQKVDELMALCDRLEQQTSDQLEAHETLVDTLLSTLTQSENATELADNWARLAAHFDTLFTTEQSIDKLKQTILQLAVMGRLVEQDAGDEPAPTLLKQIALEIAKEAKQGSARKRSQQRSNSKGPAPFNLPHGWYWERLEDLTSLITKGSSPKWQGISYTNKGEGTLFITSENVDRYRLKFKNEKFVENRFNDIQPRSQLRQGDILMNIVGASIGRTAIYDLKESANINQAVCLIRTPVSGMSREFLLYFFNSSVCLSYMFDQQVDNARANLSMSNIAKFLIPVPPKEEQIRIVQKVDELMALCDQLKERLNQASETRCQLAEAVVEKGLSA